MGRAGFRVGVVGGDYVAWMGVVGCVTAVVWVEVTAFQLAYGWVGMGCSEISRVVRMGGLMSLRF